MRFCEYHQRPVPNHVKCMRCGGCKHIDIEEPKRTSSVPDRFATLFIPQCCWFQ